MMLNFKNIPESSASTNFLSFDIVTVQIQSAYKILA